MADSRAATLGRMVDPPRPGERPPARPPPTGDWTAEARELKAMVARHEGRVAAALSELTAAMASAEERNREALEDLGERLTVRREGEELADLSARLTAAKDEAAATTARLKIERERSARTKVRLGAGVATAGTLAGAFFAAFVDGSCARRELTERLEAPADPPVVQVVPTALPVPSPHAAEIAATNARVDSLEDKLDEILARLPPPRGDRKIAQ